METTLKPKGILKQLGKIPPQALDIEEIIIGAMLQFKSAVDDVFSVFTNPEVMYKESHQYIFKAILQMYGHNKPIDLLTVSEQLKADKKLDAVGGDFELIQLTNKVSSAAHSEYHSRIVLQKFMQRQVISLCNKGVEMAYNEGVDVFDLLDFVTSSMDKVSDLTTKGHTSLTWMDAIDSIPKRVEFLTNNDGKITGITSGLKGVDKFFNGWQKQDLIVIGADSGMGKTAFVLNNMIKAAANGRSVGMFSMEMSVIQLALRGVAVDSNYHMKQLTRDGFDKAKYFDGLQETVNRIRNYPLHIDDQPALTVVEMKRKARILHRKHKIELLVVDFVQMFSGDKDIRINISEAARELKNIAKELDIPVIALSQLSREVRKAQYNIPGKYHLKESSAIEEAADIIALLYRPGHYYDKEKQFNEYNTVSELLGIESNENACLIVAKNRNGSIGTVGMHFIENKTKYVDGVDAHDVINETVPF